jgi:hypothetical protein
MNLSAGITPEARSLIEAACDDRATDAQLRDLESLLLTDEKARRLYVHLLDLDAQLQWFVGSLRDGGLAFDELVAAKQTPQKQRAPIFPAVQYPLSASFVSSGWPLAYLIAAAILAVGLLAAHLTPKSQPLQVVYRPPATSRSLPEPERPLVGRITGMVDCRWPENPKSAIRNPKEIGNPKSEIRNVNLPVALGDRFALLSGLLELTYDNGAKVILQGPATYTVESPTGGFLSLGKLTARLEKAEAGSNRKSEIPLPPSPFVVRTPTATVTDLGTEFGVEVDKRGITTSHVFRGVVEVRLATDDGRQGGQTIRLTANQSVRVEKHGDGKAATVQRGTADPTAFVRAEHLSQLPREQKPEPLRRWQTYSRQLRHDPALIAYYTFEPAGGNTRTLPNLSAVGNALDGKVDGAEWVYGRLPGKFALYFHGPGSGDRVELPEQQRFKFTGPFSIAVWFKAAGFAAPYQPLVGKGADSWRLERHERTNTLTFDNHFTPAPSSGHPWRVTNGQTDVNDRRWHLAVAVYEPAGTVAKKRLYIDGRVDAENESPQALGQNDVPVWLGSQSATANCEFQGHIDEVAILARALSADEVAAMFEAGSPANPAHNRKEVTDKHFHGQNK